LRDTITDNPQSTQSTGFLFKEASPDALTEAILRALRAYQNTNSWLQLQTNGMKQDFSWEKSAQEYRKLYKTLMEQRV
jgi:starch synthase